MVSKDVKKEYTKPEVASRYDAKRFASSSGKRRNRRKIATIRRALALIEKPRFVLDIPCGTGRLFDFLGEEGMRFVGADIAQPMLREAATKPRGEFQAGLVAADGEKLPFADKSFDAVMSIRFLFHLTPETRIKIIREMARVSRGYLILDYRLRYCLRNVVRIGLAKIGLKRALRRPTRVEMLDELFAAGVEPMAIFPVARGFSDKYIVLCRAKEPGGAKTQQ
jgi:ubiquinone/menaquinone biosynthesis C-methylase UbiE